MHQTASRWFIALHALFNLDCIIINPLPRHTLGLWSITAGNMGKLYLGCLFFLLPHKHLFRVFFYTFNLLGDLREFMGVCVC